MKGLIYVVKSLKEANNEAQLAGFTPVREDKRHFMYKMDEKLLEIIMKHTNNYATYEHTDFVSKLSELGYHPIEARFNSYKDRDFTYEEGDELRSFMIENNISFNIPSINNQSATRYVFYCLGGSFSNDF